MNEMGELMRKISLLITLMICLVANAFGKGIVLDKNKYTRNIVREHAHEHAKKEGLGYCVKNGVKNAVLKKIIGEEAFPFLHPQFSDHFYYQNTHQDTLESITLDVIWPYIKNFLATLPKDMTDMDVFDNCLTLYNSAEFEAFIEQYDYAIDENLNIFSNIYTTLPKLVPYQKLTGDQFALSKAGFYQCLLVAHPLEDKVLETEINRRIKDIAKRIPHDPEFFDTLVNHYISASFQFIYKPVLDSHDRFDEEKQAIRYKSGCLVLFDSNNLNFLFD